MTATTENLHPVPTQDAMRGIRPLVRRTLEDVRLICEGLEFPEGPVILPDGDLAVVELRASRVTRISPDGAARPIAHVEGMPNGAALGPDGALYVANNGGRDAGEQWRSGWVERIDPDTGAIDVVYRADADGTALGGPNDLVFDDTGGFWMTDYRAGCILYGRADGSRLDTVLSGEGVRYCNGVGLSPTGDRLYWSETKTRQVRAVAVTSPGSTAASNGVTVSTLNDGPADWSSLVVGFPGALELDSLAVDLDGTICVATLVDAGIAVIDPRGGPVVHYALPDEFADPKPTNLCFGGEDGRTAFITLSHSGRVVACPWPGVD
jgi:gluconolactonase